MAVRNTLCGETVAFELAGDDVLLAQVQFVGPLKLERLPIPLLEPSIDLLHTLEPSRKERVCYIERLEHPMQHCLSPSSFFFCSL